MRMFLSPHIANKDNLGVSALALNWGGRRMSRDSFLFFSYPHSHPQSLPTIVVKKKLCVFLAN